MISTDKACRPGYDIERALEDSLVLWRQLDPPPPALFAPGVTALAVDERRAIALTGRYRVGDGNEYECEVPELSPLGLRIKGPKVGRIGEWCLANIGSVGIVEGVVVQARERSFVAGVVAPPRRLRRLAERLNWRMRRDNSEVPERRAHERVEMNDAEAQLMTAEGQSYGCRIFDVSAGGAALHLGQNALYFWVDQPLVFEGRAARVLRIFPGGVVIKYE